MHLKNIVCGFVALFFVFSMNAQEGLEAEPVKLDTLTTRGQLFMYDGGSIVGGILHAYAAPLHWKEDNWIAFAGAAAGTGLLWLADEETNSYFENQAAGVPKFLQDGGYYFGKPLYNYGLTGGIYVVGILTKNEKIRKTGVLLISSATAAGIVQTFLKNAVGRARPSAGLGAATFKPFASGKDFHSFPSGHAVLAFTTAYAVSKQFDNLWIKGGICALGLVTPVSRLWAGKHWLSDVGVGMAISVATVESIDRYLNRERGYGTPDQKKKISWSFNLTPKTIGVVGTF